MGCPIGLERTGNAATEHGAWHPFIHFTGFHLKHYSRVSESCVNSVGKWVVKELLKITVE
jgi:hypothetical protein